MTGWPATYITVCPRETRLVAVIPRTSICFCSSMIAESSKAGFLIILISDPESSSKLVLVFKSGETIRAVGVVRESFLFSRGCEVVPPQYLMVVSLILQSTLRSLCSLLRIVESISRGQLPLFSLLP